MAAAAGGAGVALAATGFGVTELAGMVGLIRLRTELAAATVAARGGTKVTKPRRPARRFVKNDLNPELPKNELRLPRNDLSPALPKNELRLPRNELNPALPKNELRSVRNELKSPKKSVSSLSDGIVGAVPVVSPWVAVAAAGWTIAAAVLTAAVLISATTAASSCTV